MGTVIQTGRRLPRASIALQDGLHDGVGEGFHALVAWVAGNPRVREGSFRTRCVGGIPAEGAGIDENSAGLLTGLAEHLVLGGIRPETTAHHYQRMTTGTRSAARAVTLHGP